MINILQFKPAFLLFDGLKLKLTAQYSYFSALHNGVSISRYLNMNCPSCDSIHIRNNGRKSGK